MNEKINLTIRDQTSEVGSVQLQYEAVHATESQKGIFHGISIEPVVSTVSWFIGKVSEKFPRISSWATSSDLTQHQPGDRSSINSDNSFEIIGKDAAEDDHRISRQTGDLGEASAAPSVTAGTGYAGFFKSIGKALVEWSDWLHRGQVFGNSGTKSYSTEQVKNILSDREHRSGIFFTTETVSLEEVGGKDLMNSGQNNIPKGYAEVLDKSRLEALKQEVIDANWFKNDKNSIPSNVAAEFNIDRQQLWINGKEFKFKSDEQEVGSKDARLSKEDKLKQFKDAFIEVKERSLTDQEARDMMLLLNEEGRTSGFSSGLNPKTGICFGSLAIPNAPQPAGRYKVDQIDITLGENGRLDIKYHIPPSYLKNIVKFDGNSSYNYDFQEAGEDKPKFQTTRQYTCSYQPPDNPEDPDSKGDFEYTYSAQAYWLEEPDEVPGGDEMSDIDDDWEIIQNLPTKTEELTSDLRQIQE